MTSVRSVVFCPKCDNMGRQVELNKDLGCRTCGYSARASQRFLCNPVSLQRAAREAQIMSSPESRGRAEDLAALPKELSTFFRTLGDKQRRSILMDAYHVIRELVCSESDPENRKQHVKLAITIGELGKAVENFAAHGGAMYGEITPRVAVRLDDDEEEFRKQLEGEL